MNFLTDAGMVRLHNKKRLITLPILDIVLENYLVAHNEMTLLKALTGGGDRCRIYIRPFNQLEDKIKENSFRKNKGLGNEVGYYVFDYSAEHEL